MSNAHEHDEPTSQHLKVVSVLDCVPGHAGTPDSGEPIAILSLGHLDDVEQPLMLSLRDVRVLATRLIEVLAFHGCPVAGKFETTLARTPFRSASGECPLPSVLPSVPPDRPRLVIDGDVRRSNQTMLTALPPTGLKVRARFADGRKTIYDLVGGHRDGSAVVLLVRFYSDRDRRRDGTDTIILVRPPGQMIVRSFRPDEIVGTVNWHRFAELDDGEEFIIRGRRWQRMALADLAKLTGKRKELQVRYG